MTGIVDPSKLPELLAALSEDRKGTLLSPYKIVLRPDLTLELRPRKNLAVSDADVLEELVIEDQYNLHTFVRPTDTTIVDIGGHIGIFSVLAATFAPLAQIHSFEPHPDNYAQFNKNVRLNNLERRISVYNLGVSDREETAELYVSAENVGAHSTFHDERKKSLPIKLTTLAGIFRDAQLQHIDLLKLDCEGEEYTILLTTPPELMHKIDRIILEQHITLDTLRTYTPNSLTDYLHVCGFAVDKLKEITYPDEGTFYILHARRSNGNN